ncbi:thiopeptide-type bacteriocin biosynthesis protein [Actinophytocola glycyrrhizae]|uniref:Thiopeptide-type bacteriocin biosynthesis protein n=1 Tax=Actinophytocola glycyrrhizae TaxID=2044873 RepID=A0ABV9RUY0_9PSEU
MRAPVGQVLPQRHGPVTGHWVQLGLAPTGSPPRALFGDLAALVREWRARQVVEDFFFMHKPPGIRARFAPAPGRAAIVRAELRGLVRGWCATGLVAGVEPGVYEPEEARFGGPGPMDHAHRMFTVDAVTWLEFHARPRQTPAWALSLAMLRAVFDAMAVDSGREQAIGARIAAAGRLVPREVTGAAAVVAGLRAWWHRPGALREDEVRRLAAAHAAQVTPLAAAWAAALRDGDVDEALAWYVVFHWNRGALSFGRQALLTEALSAVDWSRRDVC